MNKVILLGRLTRDPAVQYNGEMCIAHYTLAVDRRVARTGNSNQQTADFISCTAFGKAGEFAERYLRKATKIAVVGRLQTGSYTNRDGVRVFTTTVIVEEQEFAESKAAQQAAQEGGQLGNGQTAGLTTGSDGFMNIPDGIDEELPFS